MKTLILTLLLLLFSGCELFESAAEKSEKQAKEKQAFEKKVADSKEIQLKKLSAQTDKELALINSKKELALIKKEKELEKIRLASELEKQRILLAQDKERAIFEQKLAHTNQINNMELKRYFVLILGLLALVSAFFIFYYFKKRREDKLRTYNDNLQKYFHQKENEARLKIAEKMLDTIGSGNLDKSQENQLISAFSGVSNQTYQQQLIESEIETEAELIEDQNKDVKS